MNDKAQIVSRDHIEIITAQGEKLRQQAEEIHQLKARLELVAAVEKWIRACPLGEMFEAHMLDEFR